VTETEKIINLLFTTDWKARKKQPACKEFMKEFEAYYKSLQGKAPTNGAKNMVIGFWLGWQEAKR
jgi:hypothetical protein